LSAALNDELENAEYRFDENFGFEVPTAVDGVDTIILDPRQTWDDKAAYDAQAAKLSAMFRDNFQKFEEHVDLEVQDAAPRFLEAAE
ncbi:MAG: phosphoenolpyruvate carboxykinase (ATP), partial [Pseudomonadota bacterium]